MYIFNLRVCINSAVGRIELRVLPAAFIFYG